MNVSDIVSSYLCYGCGTCNVVCGHSAITMKYNSIGRLCPTIDKSKCTDCGLCRAICPALDEKGIQLPDTEDKYVGHVENVYIGRATNEAIFRNSQSGGMVTATVKYLFEVGKIDAAIMCRVVDEVDYTPKAVVITSVEELSSCQRSSYVPIDIVSALKEAEQYNSIAVVGTGCHIQGIHALQNFSKKYNKINYTLGLICDRTLCKTVCDVLYGDAYKHEKKRIIWRDKTLNYKFAQLLIQTASGRQKEVPRWKRFELKEPFTNPRCRICFDKLNTNADVVFGDPWGMNNVDWKNGMSLVITRTQNGDSLINEMMVKRMATLSNAPMEEVIRGQQLETRKKTVSAALATYQSHKWLQPSYSQKLINKSEDAGITSLIEEFVNDESLSKNRIIKKMLRFLVKNNVKSKISHIVLILSGIAKKLIKR